MAAKSFGSNIISVAFLACFCGLIVPEFFAQEARQSILTQKDHLKKFLQVYLKQPRLADDKTTRYFYSFIDLNGDGKQEIVAYITGNSWCGTGGCTVLVLAPDDSSYRVVTRISIARLPIRFLATKSNGWHNLGVWVQGGGVQPGYEAELPFDGKSYPTNPSTFPARRLKSKTAGQVLLTSKEEGIALFQ
jgi:hypothetical protein